MFEKNIFFARDFFISPMFPTWRGHLTMGIPLQRSIFGNFSDIFVRKKKLPRSFAYPECSKRSKNWATYALERIEKDARSNFWVFVSCSKKTFFWCEIFQKSPTIFNGNSHSKLPAPPGVRQSILVIFHDFPWIFARKNVFSSSPDLYRCEISWGIHFWWFQGDTGSQSWSKVEKTNKKSPNSIFRPTLSLDHPRMPL